MFPIDKCSVRIVVIFTGSLKRFVLFLCSNAALVVGLNETCLEIYNCQEPLDKGKMLRY